MRNDINERDSNDSDYIESLIKDLADKKKPKKKRGIQYFTKDTENAIVEYNTEEDSYLRNQIYRDRIQKPLEKLVENIIHTFKFYHLGLSYKDVQSQAVAFVLEKLPLYSQDKGKAFSYFSIVVKNYLINETKTSNSDLRIKTDLDHVDSYRDVVLEASHEFKSSDENDFINLLIRYWDTNITNHFSNKNDIMVADSIMELFRRRESIELFNKKALFIMIRDMTGVKTSEITKVIKVMKSLYFGMVKEFYSTGTIKL